MAIWRTFLLTTKVCDLYMHGTLSSPQPRMRTPDLDQVLNDSLCMAGMIFIRRCPPVGMYHGSRSRKDLGKVKKNKFQVECNILNFI